MVVQASLEKTRQKNLLAHAFSGGAKTPFKVISKISVFPIIKKKELDFFRSHLFFSQK